MTVRREKKMRKYTILLAAGLVLTAFGLSGEESMPKPVCELKLDGTVENTGSGKFTAAVRGTPRWDEGREQSKALFLDNDVSNPKKRRGFTTLAIRGSAGKFDPSKPFTVSMWIMPAPETKPRSCTLFSTFSGDRGKGIRILLFQGSYFVQYGDGKKSGYIKAPRNKFPLREGIWNHIAATYDGDTCRIYLNAVPCNALKIKLQPASASEISIGSFMGGYANPFRGGISRVRIYNQALTGLQILIEARGDGLK